MARIQRNPNHTEQSYEDTMQRRADIYNNEVGELVGYDCAICKNKGLIAVIVDGYEAMKECKCMETRMAMQRLAKSGLAELLDECTFDNFITSEDWQRKIKATVELFTTNEPQSKSAWLYVGGQVGAGKTHLCTASVGKYLESGKSARYMLWRDESVSLKAIVNDDEAYASAINPLKTAEVLYIDDFFKTERGKSPTTADINLAFELLNYRYNNRSLVTIISSEWLIEDLIDFDEAVGSRIYQRSKGYCVQIGRARNKNYRLHGSTE